MGRLRHQPRLLDMHLQASSLTSTCFAAQGWGFEAEVQSPRPGPAAQGLALQPQATQSQARLLPAPKLAGAMAEKAGL